MATKLPLEKAAAAFAEANSKHPFIYELPPEQGRALLDKVQDSEVFKFPAEITDNEFDLGEWGKINVRFIKPEGATGTLPVIYYIHGAGWVFGDMHTHDKLMRELAHRTNSIVISPVYSLSPEAKYPTAIEQNYAALVKVVEMAPQQGWDVSKLIVSGDSVGGNMATVMTIMAKERGGPAIAGQLLYYPVTNADFETQSYHDFATDYYLNRDGMIWFWNQYTTSEEDRAQITASPLRATTEQLQGLPPAIILNGECDVLRDEGEAYARKLREAGVEVTQLRFQAMIHDFVMVNSLDDTCACRAAMDVSTAWANKIQGKKIQ